MSDIPVPVVGTGVSLAQNIYGSIAGDDRLSSAAAIPGEILGLAGEALMAMKDPIFALSSAGLGIVLELVDPFNEAIEMVSGSPGDMERAQTAWGEVAGALNTLSTDTASAVSGNTTQWEGKDATAATEQLQALAAAIAAAGNEASNVQQILSWCKMLAEAIKAVIESILAELVAYLITRGLIALATSAWSFGASIAAYVVSAFYKATSMFLRVMRKFEKTTGIFGKIMNVLVTQGLNRKGPFHVTPNQIFGLRDGLGYSLWKGVLIKAGIGGGLSLLGNSGEAASNVADMAAGPSGGSGGGTGRITVDLDELDALQSELDGLKGQAEPIRSKADQTTADEMTWGLPGAIGLEGHYTSTCEGLNDAIDEIVAAFEGRSMRIGETRTAHEQCDAEQARALNKLLSEL